MIEFKRKSPLTGIVRVRVLPVAAWQVTLWRAGVLLQNAFPGLSADDREFIKTGIVPEEWDYEPPGE